MPNTNKSSKAFDVMSNFILPKGKKADAPVDVVEAIEPLDKIAKAAATKRRNAITKAAELVRDFVATDERELFIETLFANEWDGTDEASWLRAAFTPKAKGNNQPKPRPVTDASVLCPVSGFPINSSGSKPKAFAGFGNDAKAKSVVNGLLQVEGTPTRKHAELLAETWHNPAAAYAVVALCHERVITSVKTVRDLFVEVQIDAAMAADVETEAKSDA